MKSKSTKRAKIPWERVYSVYEKAMEESDPRAAVERLCRGNPSLRGEVLYLIDHAHRAQSFLEGSTALKIVAALVPAPLSAGDIVDDFKIEEELGRGSFAIVYRATQLSLARDVALKVSPSQGTEGKTMAQLDHEGIVGVFTEIEVPDRGLKLIAMPYVPCLNLDELMRRMRAPAAAGATGETLLASLEASLCRPLVLTSEGFRERERFSKMGLRQAVAWIGARLAEALAHAHSKGFLHLDVKPSNILVTPTGKPKLTDFNVSARVDSLAAGPSSEFGGTFDFMAPEHREVFRASDKAAAGRLDGRADLYSLGLVLLHCLKELSLRGDRDLEAVLAKSTRQSSEQRYGSAAEMARVLDGYADMEAVRSALPRAPAFVLKHPLWAMSLGGAIPQMAAGAVGFLYNKVRIVSALSAKQQELFRLLNLYYNPTLYVLATSVWLYLILRAARAGTERLRRNRALALPLWGSAVTALGWLPGTALFPLTLHLFGGGLLPETALHFSVSFLLSFAIALAYSFLIHEYVLLRGLYPWLWAGESDVRTRATTELARVPARVWVACTLAGLVPLLGACLMLAAGPEDFSSGGYRTFRFLATALIGAGAAGAAVAFTCAQAIFRISTSLQTPERHR